MNLIEELRQLVARFVDEGIEYALCGGLAMAVYARPRATLDIDFLIEEKALNRIEPVLDAMGYSLVALPMEFKGGKVRIIRRSKIVKDSRDVLVLDLLIVNSTLVDAWTDRRIVDWNGYPLSVVSPKGLILLKSLRKSGQDLDDLNYLKEIVDEN